MSWKLEIAANAAASSWTDRTSIIDRTQVQVGGNARRGEIGTWGFVLDDDAAAITIPARRVARFIEDATTPDTVLERGRVVEKSINRGERFDGDARQYDIEFQDYNGDLGNIVVDQWSRPEETDVARVLALAAAYLAGSPRASTNLATTYVANANTVTLPKKTYEATNPSSVLSEIAEEAGKEFFVTVDGELFYDLPTSTAYAAGLSITDVSPDNETSFPPEWEDTPAQQDGSELFHRIVGIWGSGGTRTTVSDSAVATAHDYAETSVYIDAKNSTQATQKLNAMLAERKVEEERIAASINVRPDQVHLVKRGQTLSFRAAAAGITSPRVLRVVRLMWTPPAHPEGLYHARMELGFPKKLAARTKKGAPPPPGPFAPTEDTVAAHAVVYGPTNNGTATPVVKFRSTGDDPGPGYALDPIVGPFAYVGSSVYAGQQDGIRCLASGVVDVEFRGSYIAVIGAGSYTATWQILQNGAVIATADYGFTTVALTFHSETETISATDIAVAAGDVIEARIQFEGFEQNYFIIPAGAPTDEYLMVTGDMVEHAGAPNPGQTVTEEADGTGATSSFTTNFPYARGSLLVFVDGVAVKPNETDPDAGTFTIPVVPRTGSSVLIRYVAASSEATS